MALTPIKVVICITHDYKGDFMSASTSIRLDDELKDRLKNLADDRHRSAHALMLEAITEYIDREEKRSQYLQDGQTAWQHYQETGLHLSADEVEAWIDTWGTENEQDAPSCHR
jgi:predicted transcriptional regulator